MFKIVQIIEETEIYWQVELNAATENRFQIKADWEIQNQLFEDICAIAPIMKRLDFDLMEMVEPQESDIKLIKEFARKYQFREIDSALPGFDMNYSNSLR